MSSELLRDVVSLARCEKSLSAQLGYLLRGLLFLPFLMRDPSVQTGRARESAGVASQFDDIYPLF